MSSNTTIVQDLQRAVTAFNNIETAINSSGLPNTPVEDYPQAIEDLKHGGEDYSPRVNIYTGVNRVEVLKHWNNMDYQVKCISLAKYMNTNGDNTLRLANKVGEGYFDSLACGFNSADANIRVVTKYGYQAYDEAKEAYITKIMNTPVSLGKSFENCRCKTMLLGGDAGDDVNGPLTVTSTANIIAGLKCESLYKTSGTGPSPINIDIAGYRDVSSLGSHVSTCVIGLLGDPNTTIDSQYMSLLDSVGVMFNYKGAYDPSTDTYVSEYGEIELHQFGILPSHGGLVHIWPDVISHITMSHPDSTYGNVAPGTILNAQGKDYTFGSNSGTYDITFDFTQMTAAEFTGSSLFTANFVSANTSGLKRELKFSSAASSASGFSTFKTAMEAKGYTITVK